MVEAERRINLVYDIGKENEDLILQFFGS
jgi:hypothetical protein